MSSKKLRIDRFIAAGKPVEPAPEPVIDAAEGKRRLEQAKAWSRAFDARRGWDGQRVPVFAGARKSLRKGR